MKIAVFGAGGIGGYYGARLASVGIDVHFVARGAHLEAIRTNGLSVKSANGDLHIHPARVSDDPAAIGPADVVLVAVKLYDTEPEDIRPLVGPETAVVSFQNGVMAAPSLAAVLGPERVIGGMTQIISVVAAPGVIAHGGPWQGWFSANLTAGGPVASRLFKRHAPAPGSTPISAPTSTPTFGRSSSFWLPSAA